MVPAQLVDAGLQGLLHLVGTFLGDHTTQGIGNKHTHHITCLHQTTLILLIPDACCGDKESIGF